MDNFYFCGGTSVGEKLTAWIVFYFESNANTRLMQIAKILSDAYNWGQNFNL